MKLVFERIDAGMIPVLVDPQGRINAQAVALEIEGLCEDLLNFSCGHPMEVEDQPAAVERK